jgi:hypothetical protein
LRWADGGSTYTLFYFFQNQEDPLTKEELSALAEDMTTEPLPKWSLLKLNVGRVDNLPHVSPI